MLPLCVVVATLLAAACAPTPTPAPTRAVTNPVPACAPSDVAGAAADDAPAAVDPLTVAAAPDPELVVVAVDPAGRPEIVGTERADAADTAADLDAEPGLRVVGVEHDREMSTAATVTSDPYRLQQWALDDLGADALWSSDRGEGVDIAVVDTGVLGTHPDLAGRICSGVAFLGSTGVAQDGGGTTDGNGHGTHVAGIAAAGAGDGVGISGVAPAARIVPVRVLDAAGRGTSADVARGITWAVDHGAEIVNLSLGGPYSVAVDVAVDYAERHGVLVVAAAGNDGVSGAANYPAALDDALAVGSYDEGGALSWFSTNGAYVDVSAPGSGIVSTYRDGRWTYMSGTSMATPHVAGAAALLLAAEPTLSPAQARARLGATARDAGPIGHDPGYGWGRIDPAAALGG